VVARSAGLVLPPMGEWGKAYVVLQGAGWPFRNWAWLQWVLVGVSAISWKPRVAKSLLLSVIESFDPGYKVHIHDNIQKKPSLPVTPLKINPIGCIGSIGCIGTNMYIERVHSYKYFGVWLLQSSIGLYKSAKYAKKQGSKATLYHSYSCTWLTSVHPYQQGLINSQ